VGACIPILAYDNYVVFYTLLCLSDIELTFNQRLFLLIIYNIFYKMLHFAVILINFSAIRTRKVYQILSIVPITNLISKMSRLSYNLNARL
jgi:hypothetical protein